MIVLLLYTSHESKLTLVCIFRGMKIPSIRAADGTLHESMVDNLNDPSIYVLGSGTDNHAVPTHVITFKHTPIPPLPTQVPVPPFSVWEYQADDGSWHSLCGGVDCLCEGSITKPATSKEIQLGKYLQGALMAVSWRSDADNPYRQQLLTVVLKLMTHKRVTLITTGQLSSSQQEKLVNMATEVEKRLYHRACSLQSYSDHSTLCGRIRQLAHDARQRKDNASPPHQYRLGVFNYSHFKFDVVNMDQTNQQTGRRRPIRFRSIRMQLCDELRKHFGSDISEELLHTKVEGFAKRKLHAFMIRNQENPDNNEDLANLAEKYTNVKLAKRVRTLNKKRALAPALVP